MVDSTLEQILESLAQVAPADLLSILSLEDAETLRVRAARGRLARSSLVGAAVDLRPRPALAAALRAGAPQLLGGGSHDHPHDEPDTFDGLVPLPGDHSCLVAPLRTERRVLGVLSLDAAACGVFSPELVRAVGAFAHLAARVIDEESRTEALTRQVDALALENLNLKRSGAAGAALVGRSPAWLAVVEKIQLVAPTPATVLLTGETGTGKEQAARAIHQLSSRSGGPFIGVNCSALVPELALSELFGHEKGAFTGADRLRAGRFELAHGGTLFLDEVAELSPSAQAQLLRVVQERRFERVGGSVLLEADVRLVAATHRDVALAVERGQFREDLYYRLNSFPIHLPPLRERPGDVALLATDLLARLRRGLSMPGIEISRAALRRLEEHAWPGNVRELLNTLERAAILAGGKTIQPRHVDLDARAPAADRAPATAGPPVPAGLSRFEIAQAREILAALRESGGKISGSGGAAARLGLPPTTLHSAMKRLGLRGSGRA